jgi:hypothetical protein
MGLGAALGIYWYLGGAPRASDRFEPARTALSIEPDRESATVDSNGRTALDGLGLDEIVAFRMRRVRDREQLGIFPASYHPLEGDSRRIYQQISPGTRWLGPTAYYVANPYVLIVLVSANHVTPLDLACPGAEIAYSHRRIDEVHAGPPAACWFDRVFDPPYADNPGAVRLVMVNAFDAGLRHAHVDRERSANLQPDRDPANVLNGLFSQSSFFHVGRYGANNISPEDRNGWVRLARRGAPTRIHVKLWRDPPPSAAAPADMVYEVEVRP